MRIFYAVGSRPNGALARSSVWRRNLYEALVGLGHEVVEFDFDSGPVYRHADPATPGAADFISAHRPRREVPEVPRQRDATTAHCGGGAPTRTRQPHPAETTQRRVHEMNLDRG
jgi:hypothetical protein